MTEMIFHGIDNMRNAAYIIGFGLLSGLLLTGCDNMEGQPEENVEGQTVNKFLVFMDPYTRASLLDDYSVEWNVGDKIAVSDGDGWYAFEAAESGLPAEFIGEAPAADKFLAVYPFTDEAVLTEDGVMVEIPSVQEVSSGTPSPQADLWIGESRGSILQMRNVCGHILMSVEADDITAITLEGINNEVISGEIAARITADGLMLTPVAESVRSVTIVPASAETFTSGSYCFSIAPTTFERGLLLSFDRKSGGRSYRMLADSIIVSASSVVNIGNWDLTAPELGTVTTGAVQLTGAKAVLNGSMSVTNFIADRMTCGFEYKTVSATEWTRVTCPQASMEFSYELVLDSAEPHLCRAWAEVNGTDRPVYGEESKEFTPETLVLHLVFDDNYYTNDDGWNLLRSEWKWGTNSNSENENLNGTTYNYIYNGVDYPFTFWSYRPEPTSGGYALWVTSGTQKVYGLSLSYAKDLAPSQPAWMQMPGPVGLKLIEINATLYAAFKGTISPSVNENDGTASGDPVATFTGKSSFPLSLKGTKAGTRYYFCTTDNQRPTLKNITLTYLYTE